ncbi:hypothetical protein JAAARDRAFT_33636 [Jaapia argillacea MUCL 33604]|uniref:DUF6533 domain-containing protein n=1 Tax=Jaapia argillacea MUCL 33604 TaxID=933084 RepID=A0A067Q633_9AGAM|nr:hypothetical protein JAAARDRAFT_33636 [Jaapia argillacea MUCL 33604]
MSGDLVGLLVDIQVSRLCRASATAAALYDHLITFSDEVELIWKQRWSIAKVLFFVTRYCGNAVIIAVLISLLVDIPSDSVCKAAAEFQNWAATIPAWVVQVIMQFRLFALYDRSMWIATLMATSFTLQIIAVIVITTSDLHGFEVISQSFPGFTFCLITKLPRFSYAGWACIMAFETLLFSLALYKTIIRLCRTDKWWKGGNVSDVLLRDNILYYFAAFTTYTLVTIALFALPPMWIEVFGSYTGTITCTLGSRLVLNIRKASYRHQECVDTAEIGYQLQELDLNIVNRWSLDDPERR